MSVPGIGPLTASATIATIGNGAAFSKGRDFGAWLGLVPKQLSTGDRTVLGGLSKRGNKYMRTLFIVGVRAVLAKPASWAKFGLEGWLSAAARRLHKNVLAAALANNSRALLGACSITVALLQEDPSRIPSPHRKARRVRNAVELSATVCEVT